MASIELTGIHKTYPNGVVAVSGVDMNIDNGSFVVFVGPSGCGKSTLLCMVAGLEDITEGNIKIGDRVINDVSPADRDVAMGRAIVREPKVFLFDEPPSNLDAKLRVQMRIEIKRLQRRMGGTSIYVTHDQTEAMTLADSLAVINEGKIEQMGPPMELYNNPLTLFVASFIGLPQINLMNVRFDGENLINGELALDGFKGLPMDTDLVLGVRPDALEEATTARLKLRVDLVERHGSENLIYGTLIGAGVTDDDLTGFCFKSDKKSLPENGSILNLDFDSNKSLIFIKDSGERLI